MIAFNNMDEVYVYFSKRMQNAPSCAPRGMEIKEVLGAAFELTNPRNRLISLKERDASLYFHVGEFMWYIRGSEDLDIINYYSKMYHKFSDDAKTLYGAYGKRIFKDKCNGKTQWQALIETLKRDMDSRQAVLSIHEPRDLATVSRDIPCTCVIQFLVRQNKLNCIVYMRSNDLYLGLPYDVFSFTMLQELLATQLNLELGSYRHCVGSLHVYKRHYEKIQQCAEIHLEHEKYIGMQPMEVMTEDHLTKMLTLEESIRKSNEYDESIYLGLPDYWKNFIDVLRNKRQRNSCQTYGDAGFRYKEGMSIIE